MPVTQRQKAIFTLAEGQYNDIKLRMLNWSKQFSIFLFLDSNEYRSAQGSYECLLASGTAEDSYCGTLSEVQNKHDAHKDWLFGHISYDHKNELEALLSSRHGTQMYYPGMCFFRPQIVCYIRTGSYELVIESQHTDPQEVYQQLMAIELSEAGALPKLQFTQGIQRDDYLDKIAALRKHIADGDCYEINFCNEGQTSAELQEPLDMFRALNKLSPAPFAAYYRLEDKHMACSSPERYLRKSGDKLISQPIKGTARRAENAEEDEAIKTALSQNIKERAENVMITDLVRNDLARSCEAGSVQVDELFGIYSFPQVHQMISTISGQLRKDVPFTEAIAHSFPMGSMTGAPKIKVMQLIDKYETARRELFSGTVGYISPEGDFDFNVIIRSLFYNETSKRLSYQTGGAITYDSNAEQEWEEMRLKAWALERIFAT